MKIILGSKSIGRKHILQKAGYEFEIMVSNIDEKTIRTKNFKELPLLLARAKAKKLLEQINDPAILITCDQVVICNNKLREKPESEKQTREYLKSYEHYPAQTNTAIVVTNTKSGKQAEGSDFAKVFFKKIPDQIINQLVKEKSIMNAAGGFIIDDPLLKPFIDHIEGSIDSVIGLPLKLTEELILKVK